MEFLKLFFNRYFISNCHWLNYLPKWQKLYLFFQFPRSKLYLRKCVFDLSGAVNEEKLMQFLITDTTISISPVIFHVTYCTLLKTRLNGGFMDVIGKSCDLYISYFLIKSNLITFCDVDIQFLMILFTYIK